MRKSQPWCWEVTCPRAWVPPPLPHLPPSAQSAGPHSSRSMICTTSCPRALQSALSFSSLYLGTYAFWTLELWEPIPLGSLETEAGTSPPRGLESECSLSCRSCSRAADVLTDRRVTALQELHWVLYSFQRDFCKCYFPLNSEEPGGVGIFMPV